MKKTDIVEQISQVPTLTPAELAHAATAGWSDDNLITKALITRLAEELGAQQKWTCSFCKLSLNPMPGRGVSFDVEHFIEKGQPLYAVWQFEPLNLSIACRDCNRKKRWRRKHIFTPLGKATAASTFPMQSNHYDLIHPHFDKFTDYLEVHRGWIYKIKKGMNGNSKAKNHLAAFELNKVAQAERKNRVAILANMSSLGRMVTTITFAVNKQAAVSDLINEMKAASKLYKDKNSGTLETVVKGLKPLSED